MPRLKCGSTPNSLTYILHFYLIFLVSELCVPLTAPENYTIYFGCDSNNNVQANIWQTVEIASLVCVNGVWITSDQPKSNGMLRKNDMFVEAMHPICDSCPVTNQDHTCKCIRRYAGIYAYCRYFIDRMW